MIDDIFQAGTDQAIRDRLQRPVVGPVQQPGAFANFWQVYKSPAASVLDLTAAKADETYGFGQVLAAGGTDSGGGMFSLQSPAEKAQSDAAHDKLMRQGVDMNSPEGDALRVKAREFMPDPATSGTATRVVAGLLNFAPQAAAAATAGPGGIIDLGVNTGLNESDALRQQGVDFATRSKAGTVAGAAAAASMLLPMSGASAGVRFLKGAAGGEVSMAGQAELEHLILQHAGYDKQAAAYDPLDPVTLALGVVPGVLGAALGHGGPVPVRTPEQMRAAVDFTPAEQAHSDAIEGSAANLRQLDEAIATTKDPAALADLKKLRDQAQALHDAARAAATDLNVEAAVRVRQTAAAIDESRLTPDTDVAGIDQHQQAVEMASDQLARGVPVDVSPAFGDTMLDSMRESRVTEDRIDFLEAHRAQLLGDAGNLLGPGDVADLRRQVADLQSQLVDAGPAAVKARAQELQAQTPGSWIPQQFENPANIDIHVRTTAQEILADFPEGIDVLITGVGTGGHITGVAKVLKAKFPQLKVFAVEPTASPVISGGQPSPHPIQGIGAGFIPKNLDTSLLDGVIQVDAEPAREFARRAAREEGLLVGISSGATLAAIAQKLPELPAGAKVLGFNYDTGERYLSVEGFLPA